MLTAADEPPVTLTPEPPDDATRESAPAPPPKLSIGERSRENAKKSTGPKTEKGKRHASRNAWKHGLTAGRAHSREDRLKLNLYTRQFKTDYRPQGIIEHDAIDRLAINKLRLDTLDVELSTLEYRLADETGELNRLNTIPAILALLRQESPEKFQQLDLLHRYRRDIDRDWRQTVAIFSKAQHTRQCDNRTADDYARTRAKEQRSAAYPRQSPAMEAMLDAGFEQPGAIYEQLLENQQCAQRSRNEPRLEPENQQLTPIEPTRNEPDAPLPVPSDV